MGQRIPEKEIANFQFNVFCNVADIIEGNGASYFQSISEQHVPTLTNSQTARTDVIMFLIVSGHVETVCLLSKKNAKPKDCVEISVDAEDYYRIKSSEKDI